ncbi:MAG TPA: PilZ domain-containing protein [Methylovirgula sp.]|nr:PilZ domain-containing protein [Methylovirgula sp.]
MPLKLRPLQKPLERRRHQRVTIALLGRYMLEDKREYTCQTANMSPGGVSVIAPVRGAIGERVVAYLDQIGRIEGRIVRHTERGFAMQLSLPYAKREKIANQLTWLANREALGMPEDRRHERIVPHRRHAVLKIEGEREHVVKLIDVSVSGAAISTTAQPAIGTKVLLGDTPGQVVRAFEGGLGITFEQMLSAENFDENIKL